MSRFTQFPEDSSRLPIGIKRVAYDASTSCYTFIDSNSGKLYRGEPGEEYGMMHPTLSPIESVEQSRPGAFASDSDSDSDSEESDGADGKSSKPKPKREIQDGSDPEGYVPPVSRKRAATFGDFLPPSLISSVTASEAASTASGAGGEGLGSKATRWKSIVQRRITMKAKPMPFSTRQQQPNHGGHDRSRMITGGEKKGQ